jgi:alkylation response protein AidB-like acyl-CoA dehydrogenase
MQITFSRDDEEFRLEVRRFFEHEYPRDILDKMHAGAKLERADHVRSQQALQSRGWLGVTWPTEFGGPGWSPCRRYLFDEELERAGAPNIIPMAVLYVGPIIIAFGTPEQRRRWLPDILESRALWAQGYSEPGAGSDLAGLALRAERVDGGYVLNGSKVWTTLAHWANWIFCLARTSAEARRQDGISFICVDLATPGIAVQPLITLNGAWELNRVVFDEVRVPEANRIGAEGQGWRQANVLLANERLSYAHIGRKKADLRRLRALAGTTVRGRGSVLDDPLFAARLAALEIELAALEIFVLRALAAEAAPALVSSLKIKCTQCAQHVTELYVELAGRQIGAYPARSAGAGPSLPVTPSWAPSWADAYLFERSQTIYGGTTEIQKNIIWRELARGQTGF